MKSGWSLSLFLVFSLSSFSAFSAELVTAKPRLVRSSPRTEVFFVDHPKSYWIDSDTKHNAYQKAFLDAAKKNQIISFSVDPETRKIVKVDGVDVPVVEVPAVEDTVATDSKAHKR